MKRIVLALMLVYMLSGCERTAALVSPPEQRVASMTASPDVIDRSHRGPLAAVPTTTIDFSLPDGGHVRLALQDGEGSLVTVLLDGDVDAGMHAVEFNASNLSSGVYFYILTYDGGESIRKMLLIK